MKSRDVCEQHAEVSSRTPFLMYTQPTMLGQRLWVGPWASTAQVTHLWATDHSPAEVTVPLDSALCYNQSLGHPSKHLLSLT